MPPKRLDASAELEWISTLPQSAPSSPTPPRPPRGIDAEKELEWAANLSGAPSTSTRAAGISKLPNAEPTRQRSEDVDFGPVGPGEDNPKKLDWYGPDIQGDPTQLKGWMDYQAIRTRTEAGHRRGFIEAISDWKRQENIPFAGDVLDAVDLGKVAVTAYKLKHDQPVDDQDVLDFNIYMAGLQEQENATIGGKAGDTVRKSAVFMAELGSIAGLAFLTLPAGSSGGIGAASAKITGKTALRAAKVKARRAISQYLIKQGVSSGLAHKATKVAVTAAAMNAGALVQDILRPGATMKSYQGRRIETILNDGTETEKQAVFKAILDTHWEHVSEMSGGPMGDVLISAIPAAARKKLLQGVVFQFLAGKAGSPSTKKVVQAFNAMGYHGVAEEMLEERVGGFLRGLTGVSGPAGLAQAIQDAMPQDWEQVGVEGIAFAVPGMAMKAAEVGYSGISKGLRSLKGGQGSEKATGIPRTEPDGSQSVSLPVSDVEEPPPSTSGLDPSEYPVSEVPVDVIHLSKDAPNFKANADESTGVVEGQRLSGKYNRLGTAPIVLWERNDGQLEVITGRHRLDLAKTTGEKTIPSQIVREKDGFSLDQAKVLDAQSNIRDGQGEVSDYAHYFKESGIDETAAKSEGLLSRSKGKAGWSLGKDASDDLYALYRDGKIGEKAATAIASIAPGNDTLQNVAIRYALKNPSASASTVANYLAAAMSGAEGLRGTGPKATQGKFDWDKIDPVFEREASAVGEAAEAIRKDLQEQLSVLNAGKRVSKEKFAELAARYGISVDDVDAVKSALPKVKDELADWDPKVWPGKPELVNRARERAGLKPFARPETGQNGAKTPKAGGIEKAPEKKPDEGGIKPPQGELLGQDEGGLKLVGEEATDAEREKRELDEAEAKRKKRDEAQGSLFGDTPPAPNPTPGQKEAGNYQKEHIKYAGLDISIENQKGMTRSGKDKTGKEWSQVLANDYGYVRGTKGKDKDHVDVFIAEGRPLSEKVYVVNQVDPSTSRFDEHKVMLGFNSAKDAEAAYLSNYQKGWKGASGVVEMSMEAFKAWSTSETDGPAKGRLSPSTAKKYAAVGTPAPAPDGKSNNQRELEKLYPDNPKLMGIPGWHSLKWNEKRDALVKKAEDAGRYGVAEEIHGMWPKSPGMARPNPDAVVNHILKELDGPAKKAPLPPALKTEGLDKEKLAEFQVVADIRAVMEGRETQELVDLINLRKSPDPQNANVRRRIAAEQVLYARGWTPETLSPEHIKFQKDAVAKLGPVWGPAAKTPEEFNARRDAIVEVFPYMSVGDHDAKNLGREAYDNEKTDRIAALWGFTETDVEVRGGLWHNFNLERVETVEAPSFAKGRSSRNEIRLARGPNGMFAATTSVSVGDSGASSMPDIYDTPHATRDAAMQAAVDGFRETVKDMVERHPESNRAQKESGILRSWLDSIAPEQPGGKGPAPSGKPPAPAPAADGMKGPRGRPDVKGMSREQLIAELQGDGIEKVGKKSVKTMRLSELADLATKTRDDLFERFGSWRESIKAHFEQSHIFNAISGVADAIFSRDANRLVKAAKDEPGLNMLPFSLIDQALEEKVITLDHAKVLRAAVLPHISSQKEKDQKKKGGDQKKPEPIGKNPAGQDIFVDKNGVRYIVEDGVKQNQSVRVDPNGYTAPVSVDELKRRGSTTYLTVEEVGENETNDRLPVEQALTIMRNRLMPAVLADKSVQGAVMHSSPDAAIITVTQVVKDKIAGDLNWAIQQPEAEMKHLMDAHRTINDEFDRFADLLAKEAMVQVKAQQDAEKPKDAKPQTLLGHGRKFLGVIPGDMMTGKGLHGLTFVRRSGDKAYYRDMDGKEGWMWQREVDSVFSADKSVNRAEGSDNTPPAPPQDQPPADDEGIDINYWGAGWVGADTGYEFWAEDSKSKRKSPKFKTYREVNDWLRSNVQLEGNAPPPAPPPPPTPKDQRKARRKKERKQEGADIDALWDDLNGLAGRMSLGVDPKVVEIGTKLAAVYIKKGTRNFRDFVADAYERLGENWEKFKDHLLSFWQGAAALPEFAEFADDIEDLTRKQASAIVAEVEAAAKDDAADDDEDVGDDGDGKVLADSQFTVAKELAKRIASGAATTTRDVEALLSNAHGGTMASGAFSIKDVYDTVEMGVNQYLMEAYGVDPKMSPAAAKATIGRLRDMLDSLPTQTNRSQEMIEMQQFSTPPHLAFVANWVANLRADDTYLEPSAGMGGIAVFGKVAGVKTIILNELSDRRAELLDKLDISDEAAENENAEHLYAAWENRMAEGKMPRPTVVVMNPPFSNKVGDKVTKDLDTAANHIEEALKLLPPGGRLVSITGRGMAMDKPSMALWWRRISQTYHVKANVGIDGNEYRKYGTTFGVQLIVIDKPMPNDVVGLKIPVIGTVQKAEELVELLTEVRDGRPIAQVSGSGKGGSGGSGGSNSGNGPKSPSDANGRGGKAGSKPGKGGRGVGGRSGGNGRAGGRSSGGRGRSGGNSRSGDSRGGSPGERSDPSAGSSPVALSERTDAELAESELQNGIFSVHVPQMKVEGALPHPTELVESSAMQAIKAPTPVYQPSLPKELIESGNLSEAQLQPIIFAGDAHSRHMPDGRRVGYFIGDGTGVGKTRELLGIILDNWAKGRRRAVYVTKNQKLVSDVIAELDVFGLGGKAINLSSIKEDTGAIPDQDGIVFTTYDQLKRSNRGFLNNEYRRDPDGKLTRIEQLEKWASREFDGVIILDESHNAQNAMDTRGKRGKKKASASARSVIDVQQMFPEGRVVYSSATGATEVLNFAYAERLGLWGHGTPFAEKGDFISNISDGGMAAMEIVARDLKRLGMYCARTLSFRGVEFAPPEETLHTLDTNQRALYDKSSSTWQRVMLAIDGEIDDSGLGKANGQAAGSVRAQIQGAAQRFYNQMLSALMMPSILKSMKSDLAAGKSIVLQLVNHYGTKTEDAVRDVRQNQGGIEDWDSIDTTPRAIILSAVSDNYPTKMYEKVTDANGNEAWQAVMVRDPETGEMVHADDPDAVRRKNELIAELALMDMPQNPIDQIINEFGPEAVAEVTGRKMRIIDERDDNGNVTKTLQTRSDSTSEKEISEFMDGVRRILLFTQAGATGRSYHASLDVNNQQQRVHYLIQPGWRADEAVQGLGRSHRTNQAVSPLYKLWTTDIKGHKRFISTIARRLGQLGALSSGERKSQSQGLFSEKDNLETDYGHRALRRFWLRLRAGHYRDEGLEWDDTIRRMGLREETMTDRDGDFDPDKLPPMNVFLNRVLVQEIDRQNQVFDLFSSLMQEFIEAAIERGEYEEGLQHYRATEINRVNDERVFTHPTIKGVTTDIVETEVVEPVQFTPFAQLWNIFYEKSPLAFVKNIRSGKVYAIFEAQAQTKTNGEVVPMRRRIGTSTIESHATDSINVVSKRDAGKRPAEVSEEDWTKELLKKGNYLDMSQDEARAEWEDEIRTSDPVKRSRVTFLSGTLIPIWDRIANIPFKVFRVPITGGETFIGIWIPPSKVAEVRQSLGAGIGEMTPENAMQAILSGSNAKLANGWTMKRSLVMGGQRIEVVGLKFNNMKEWSDYIGGITETIGHNPRFFIPTGERGIDSMRKLMAKSPIVNLTGVSVVAPAAYLKSKGLDVAQTASGWLVSGKGTFPNKQAIRDAGGKFDGMKGWKFTNDPTDALARALGHVGQGGPGAGSFSMRARMSPRLRKGIARLVEYAKDHEGWKDWYDRHQGLVDELFGEDATMFRQILAATSQAQGVAGNVTTALEAYESMKTGKAFRGLAGVIRNLEAIREGGLTEGPKVGQFARANMGDTGAITVDRHISRLLFGVDRPTTGMHSKAHRSIREVAEVLGWTPRDTQAALWAAQLTMTGTDLSEVPNYAEVIQRRKAEIREIRSRYTQRGRKGGSFSQGTGVDRGGSRAAGAGGAGSEADNAARLGERTGDLPEARRRLEEARNQRVSRSEVTAEERALWNDVEVDQAFAESEEFIAAANFARQAGLQAVPIKGGFFNGFINGDTVLIDSSGDVPAMATSRHEVFHSLDDAGNLLVAALKALINPESAAVRAYRKMLNTARVAAGMAPILDNTTLLREYAADVFAGQAPAPAGAAEIIRQIDEGLSMNDPGPGGGGGFSLKRAKTGSTDQIIDDAARSVVNEYNGDLNDRDAIGEFLRGKWGEGIAQYIGAVQGAITGSPTARNQREFLDLLPGGDVRSPVIPATAEEADMPDAKTDLKGIVSRMLDKWFSDKDRHIQKARSEGARLQDRIKASVGEKHYGQKSRDVDMAIQVNIDLRGQEADQIDKYRARLTPEQRRLVEMSQNLTPEQEQIADDILESNKATGIEGMQADVIHNIRENYTMRLWKKLTEGEQDIEHASLNRVFGATTARSRLRTLESILHGWAEGKDLLTKGATNSLVMMKEQVYQTIYDRGLIKMARKNGLISSSRKGADWKLVDHPSFKWWEHAGKVEKGRIYGPDHFVDAKGNVFTRRPYYAPPELADRLNRILSTSKLYGIKGVKALTRFNAEIKQTILTTSLFHLLAFVRSYLLGGRIGSKGLNVKQAYRDGLDAVKRFTPELEELVGGGLTIGRIQDWEETAEREQTRIGAIVDKIPGASQAKKGVLALQGWYTHLLFNQLGAGLKAQAALLEFRHLLKKNRARIESGETTRHELAKMVANLINDDFGGLHHGRLERNQTAQHIFRLFALAPDWTESNIRSMVKAFKRGEEGALYRDFWARIAVKGLVATALFNLLMASLDDDEDILSMFRKAWEEGRFLWMDVDVTPLYRAIPGNDSPRRKYFSILGHFKDPMKFVAHPVRSAKHKGSILFRLAWDAGTGTDWAGRKFTSVGELLGMDENGKMKGQLVAKSWAPAQPLELSRLPSYLAYEARSSLPIQTQAMWGWLAGEEDGFDALLRALGIHIGRSYKGEKKKSSKKSTALYI